MRQYETFELCFEAPAPGGSHVEVDFFATFTLRKQVTGGGTNTETNTKTDADDNKETNESPCRYSQTVKGFYAGNNCYKVRFLPMEPGIYEWQTEGIIWENGQVECLPAFESKHGPVRAVGTHFYHADGTLYQPFGTTVYALAHQSEKLLETTMETLERSPFNKVRFCMFPKHYDFNHNEPDYYPFEPECKHAEETKSDEKNMHIPAPEEESDGQFKEQSKEQPAHNTHSDEQCGLWDVHHPVFAFWDAFEALLKRMDDHGIQADLILFHPYDRWGFSNMGHEKNMVYLEYLLRRFGSFPNVWWSLANEYDLMEHISVKDFEEFSVFLHDNEPCPHLLSNHNCFGYWDFTRPEVTHCCIQDINVGEVPELIRQYGKPVVFDECRYEGNVAHNWGNISAKEMVHRFWTAGVYGGYCTHGETYYSDDDVLWWSRGGKLKGESAERIAFLRDIFEELDGPVDFVNEGLVTITVDMVEEMKKNGIPDRLKNDFFAKGLITFPKEKLLPFMIRNRPCLGHVGDKAYIRYMEKECAAQTDLLLPQDGNFTVEVIDTWKMKRMVVAKNVSGKITVALPGKEGMAILAKRN